MQTELKISQPPLAALLSAEMLAEQLAHPARDSALVIVDCRFSLQDRDAGLREYAAGHIPGAHYADLERDLSGAAHARSGRHPLPHAAAFAQRLRRWQITRQSRVVAYDDGGGIFAARLWWMLRASGHKHAAILDGGYRAWQQAGFADTREIPRAAATDAAEVSAAPLAFDAAQIFTADQVAAHLATRSIVLVDARAPSRFRGEHEPLDTRAGHVPGAVNFPFQENLDANGKFLPPAILAARFQPLLKTHAPDAVVHMCGSGITACHNLFAMEIAGLPGAKLYAGSWSDWIRDPNRAVAGGGE